MPWSERVIPQNCIQTFLASANAHKHSTGNFLLKTALSKGLKVGDEETGTDVRDFYD